jgi:hypothetical protein
MHVFVSHSRVNSNAAFRLCDELRKRNVETWLDVSNLMPGADWDQAVASAIQSATGFVFLIGPVGSGDRGQTFEWQQVVEHEYYLDLSKPMIPVLIGGPEIPGFLKTRRSLLIGDAPNSFEEVTDQIVRALQNPTLCLDEKKLELGREARRRAIDSFREYSEVLGKEDIKRAELRAVE